MRVLSDYKDYEGIDVSLDISLYEYGFLCKLVDKETREYKFIIGIDCNEGGYTTFDWFDLSFKEFIELLNQDWLVRELESFYSAADTTKQDIIDTFPYSISNLVQHFGHANILGESNYPFAIHDPIGYAEWNRFDICGAYYVWATHYYKDYEEACKIHNQLDRLKYKPGLSEERGILSENGREILYNLINRKK